MRIEEVEAFTELTRGNIRFYEQSGLLGQAGGGNTTSEYSREYVAELQKIKLLRLLRIPVDIIQRLQMGRLQLNGVINDKLQQLSMYLSDHEAADAICRGILEDHVGYAGLDAEKYLKFINELPKNSAWYFTIPSDEKSTVCYPWRRYFARSVDLSIYSLIWCAIGELLLRWNPAVSFPARLVEIYMAIVLMLFIEPLLLSVFGTTPGKLIFGFRVEGINGNKPRYGQALERTWTVLGVGMGYNIPFYNIYKMVKSYKACKAGEELEWDDPLPYTIRDTKGVRILICIAAMAIILMANLFILFQARMPIHRGALTAEEFIENYNDLIDYNGIDYGYHLNADGRWIEDKQDNGTIININMNMYFYNLIDLEITETDGVVTKVGFSEKWDTSDWVTAKNNQIYFAVLSFLGAQKEINCIDIMSHDFAALLQNNFQDFSFTKAGVKVTYDVEYSGYNYAGSALIPKEGESQYYHAVFTMERP